jgi:hypothetical protein
LPRLDALTGSLKLSGAEAVALLSQLPGLVHFAPWNSALAGKHLETLLASPQVSRLVELDLNSNGLEPFDLQRLAACSGLGALRRLGLGYATTRSVAPLAEGRSLGALEALDLRGLAVVDLASLATAPFARSLRTLVASAAMITPADARALVQLPALEFLAGDTRDASVRATLEATIPRLVLNR